MLNSILSNSFHSPLKTDVTTSFYEKKSSPRTKRSVSPLGRSTSKVSTPSVDASETTEYERKTKIIHDEMNNHIFTTEEKLKDCASEIVKVEEKLTVENKKMEALIETISEEIHHVQNKINKDAETEKNQTIASRAKIFKDIESRTHKLKTDFTIENQKNIQNMNEHYQKVEEQVTSLGDEVKLQRKARNKSNESLIGKFSSHVARLQETLDTERRTRLKAEDHLLRAFDDLNKKLTTQVAVQKETREKFEEYIIQLLDSACNKLETHTQVKKAAAAGRTAERWLPSTSGFSSNSFGFGK